MKLPDSTHLSPRKKSDAMTLSVGDAIEFKTSRVANPLTGCVIGFDVGVCFLVKVPFTSEIHGKMLKGDVAKFRYESEGALYGFNGEIISFITKPSLMLVFSYPNSVDCLELRAQKRAQCFLPCRLETDGKKRKAIIADLSVGGCQIMLPLREGEGESPIDGGAIIALDLVLPGERSRQVDILVKSMELHRGRVVIGAQFLSLDLATKASMEHFMGNLAL